MYCPRCRIETEDIFCENCGGATVVSEEVAAASVTVQANISDPILEEVKKEKVKVEASKLSIKKIVSSMVVFVIIIGALVGYNVLKEQYTPRKTVQKYYDYLVNKDYDNAYKILIDTDNNFLSKDIYKSSMKQLDFKQYTIKNFSPNDFQNTNISKTGNMFSVQAGEQFYPVSVVNMGKKLLFLNDYKINADNFTVKWLFTAPVGVKISVLGKEPVISNELNTDNMVALNSLYKPSSKIYEIGHIFNGSYDVSATMEGAKEVKYSGAKAGNKIIIKFEPTEELVKQLQDKAKSYLDLYYVNSSKDKYSDLLTTDSNALTRINQFASYSSGQVVNKLKDIKVTKQSLDDIEHAMISVKCTIEYEDSSWASWGGHKQTGTKDMTTDFYFVKQNDKWLIVDTGYIN